MKKEGLKLFKELFGADKFERDIMPDGKYETDRGWTLAECLDSYFRDCVKITNPFQRRKEIALTLYGFTKAGMNVDDLPKKSKVVIEQGALSVLDAVSGKPVKGWDAISLRKEPGFTARPE